MKKKFLENDFTRNVVTLLTGTTVAQAIPIVISPILTRVYSPDDFGVFALYMSIVSIVAVVATANYELAIMLPEKKEDAANIAALSLIITIIISMILLIIVIIFNKSFTNLLGNPSISKWLYFVPLSVFLTGIYQTFNFLNNRNNKYKRLSANRIYQSTSTASINVLMGLGKMGPSGLILGGIIGQLIAGTRLAFLTLKDYKSFINSISVNNIKKQAKRYSNFPKFSMLSSFLNAASMQVPVIVLSIFFSSTIVGYFSLAQRVLQMPMAILGGAVAQVFFQTSADLKNKDLKALRNTTYSAYKKMMFIGIVPMSLVFGFGDYVFMLIFGPDWEMAGQIARILSIWLLFVFVSSPLSNLTSIMEKQKVGMHFNILIFISRILSLFLGIFYFNSVIITLILFSITGILFWVWLSMYILYIVGISVRKSLIFTLLCVGIFSGLSLIVRWTLVGSVW